MPVIWGLSSHLWKGTAASTYLTGEVGGSELTQDKCLKGAASCEHSTAVTRLCSSRESKATHLQQAAGILLKISWRQRGCV